LNKIGDSYYIQELEVTNYTTDSNNREVKERQWYKDKTMLISIMTKYKIEHNFNFKVNNVIKKRV